MREGQQPQNADKAQRSGDDDRKLLGGFAHDRPEDEHADELGHHQYRKDRDVVAGIGAERVLDIVDRHAGNEVHAALTEEVEPQEDQERAASEHAGRLGEALRKRGLDGLLLLFPGAEEHGDRADEEENAEEEHALHVLRRIVGLLDDHARDKTADGGAERREDHAHVGELGAHGVVVHHVGKQAVIRHAQHSEARVEQAVHHHIEDIVRDDRRGVDVDPHGHEGDGRGDAAHEDVEPFGAVFRAGPLAHVAHDGVGDGVPDLADHGDRAGERRVHAERVGQEDDEERVDDDEASAAEDLSDAVHESVEKAVARLSAADFLFHSFPLVLCLAPPAGAQKML